MAAKFKIPDLAFTACLSFLALIPRLYVAIAWASEPVWDGHYYDFGAKRIADGFGYSDDIVVGGINRWHPWCHYPVGYSGFLAILYKIFGYSPHVATIANAVVGTLIVALTHRIAMRFLSKHRARLAAVLYAVNPASVIYSALVMTELVSTLGPMLVLWLALRDAKHHAWRGAVVSGIALGLASLVHPQAIILGPVIGLVITGKAALGLRLKRSFGLGACATVVALLVVSPWTVRNCRVMDGCAFVSTNGGWNLAIGAFSRATGRFETLRSSDGCRVVTGQVQQDRCWAQFGMAEIRKDPWRWLGLAPKKLGYCFDHESFPIEYLREANPKVWPETRRAAWRERLTWVHRCLLTLAVFGFVARAARTWKSAVVEIGIVALASGLVFRVWSVEPLSFWPLAMAIVAFGLIPRPSVPYRGPVGLFILYSVATFMLLHIAFFGEDRYHVPLTPWLCMLAAAALRRPPAEDMAQLRTTD